MRLLRYLLVLSGPERRAYFFEGVGKAKPSHEICNAIKARTSNMDPSLRPE